MVRLSLDLDGVSQLNLLKAYFNLRYFTRDIEVFFTSVENGKENYHIIAYDLPDLPFDKLCEFRAMYGDDIYRIYLDQRLESKPKQVLFYLRCKMDRKSGRWMLNQRTRILNILWEPWCSKLPAHKPCRRRKTKIRG